MLGGGGRALGPMEPGNFAPASARAGEIADRSCNREDPTEGFLDGGLLLRHVSWSFKGTQRNSCNSCSLTFLEECPNQETPV